ncbi:hypothetical protein FOE67_08500 [Streptomyces calidiresistens]|uniref:Uncharacterized protein n=1 Tax=Streptomyces calidiresistens TaxID=1485586 RepID=A0A7W3XWA2_9ACTN|nr:hypothetical protein [Streptomyces calidiresistens]
MVPRVRVAGCGAAVPPAHRALDPVGAGAVPPGAGPGAVVALGHDPGILAAWAAEQVDVGVAGGAAREG